MKALIFTHGTRGDVQPYVALAHALRRAGHGAVLAGPAGSASLAEPYHVPYVPLSDAMNEGMDDPEVRAAIENNYRGIRGKLTAIKLMRQAKTELRTVFDEIAAIPADDVDVVVHPVNSPGQFLAEKLGVPSVAVGLQPGWVPTDSVPSPFVPFPIPRALNRASYGLNRVVLRALVGAGTEWRRDTLELPRRPHQNDALRRPDGGPATVLQAFSTHALPAGARYQDSVHTTGYWFLPAAEDWTPPERLRAFLDAGEPPVYVGFGSMAGTQPARVGRTVVEAARRAGVRVVLITGWGGIDAGADADRVLVLDQAPHDWLFPRTAAVVHHGGGGTTAAALASGRPQVVCPFIADQPYWGRRMHAVGVAPGPVPQRRLTAERLAGALRQAATDPAMRARAAELGATIGAENGVANAVAVIERTVARS
ncbi:glycosyltransferase [Myceligenerans pegani]|uniref:Glycosyltransferase family 1 protein n=1 Tax=Myceligenerans pegani TaxID=2776917 RepID=A0ABR9N3Y0_9MICO|nr:glycosyltransferase [Myceligenerans sp. TRM 65318]MBE1878369.1 glycosyltransferase family 1 protein [Myceligenerans sp. TRM 65318]MBE3020640.1 glycosyltransferase family 1 protein [Myceligenerans sp. TRM 65318]